MGRDAAPHRQGRRASLEKAPGGGKDNGASNPRRSLLVAGGRLRQRVGCRKYESALGAVGLGSVDPGRVIARQDGTLPRPAWTLRQYRRARPRQDRARKPRL